MALNDLQKSCTDKVKFYAMIQQFANEVNRITNRAKDLAESISGMDGTDLTAIGITDAAMQTTLQDFRTGLNEWLSCYDGNATTPAQNMSALIDQLRSF